MSKKMLVGLLALVLCSAAQAAQPARSKVYSVTVSAENAVPADGGDTHIAVKVNGKVISIIRGNVAGLMTVGGKDGKVAAVMAFGRSLPAEPVNCTDHYATLIFVHPDGKVDNQQDLEGCKRFDLKQDGDRITLSVWAKDAAADARPERVTVWRNGIKQ